MNKTAPVLTAVVAALAGCGTDSSTGETSSASASSSAPAGCALADLKVSLGQPEGAAGSTFLPVRLTNTSDGPCRTGGFGGVSLVTLPRSDAVGASADRVQQYLVRRIALQPGKRVEATLRITNAENFPHHTCRPEPTTGLRVFPPNQAPPNQTNAAYVPHAATGCANPQVHLLELRPYQAG